MNSNVFFSHSGTTNPAVSDREKAHSTLARQIAAEGMVLLKNDGLLPLRKVPMALLGSGAVKTVKGGIGSGDVNNRKTVSIYEGLQNAGIPIVSEDWLEEYEACYQDARENWKQLVLEQAKTVENCFDAYSANPFVLPEGRPVTSEDISGAEAAIYVISRISGEGKDRRLAAGDYYLSQREQETLRLLNDCKVPTVLILNAGVIIELTDILEACPMIQAVLNISQPGQEAGDAVADVLFGKATPGGRLTATWPKRYEDIPYSDSFHVDLWLAPGMNIQRNPLCGRNFEYYSEDPMLAGAAAAAVTAGVQSQSGCGVTIKHFAGNNQEDNRMGVDSRISPRALREIYLRNFEIAVKTAKPKAIMTSYNLINGVHSANSRELCTTVAREEWGFNGIIMSDWNTTVPEDGSTPWKCADAGNDIIMPGNPQDAQNIRQAVKDGLLSEEAIRACAGRIIDLATELSECR